MEVESVASSLLTNINSAEFNTHRYLVVSYFYLFTCKFNCPLPSVYLKSKQGHTQDLKIGFLNLGMKRAAKF